MRIPGAVFATGFGAQLQGGASGNLIHRWRAKNAADGMRHRILIVEPADHRPAALHIRAGHQAKRTVAVCMVVAGLRIVLVHEHHHVLPKLASSQRFKDATGGLRLNERPGKRSHIALGFHY